MYIKKKHKILRKYDSDIWNYLYLRRRKNKFFTYFRLSIIHKIQSFFKTPMLYLAFKNRFLKTTSIKSNVNRVQENLFKIKNFRRFFRRVNIMLEGFFLKLSK